MKTDKGAAKLWYTYVISTELETLYVGITTDVERRFSQHLDAFNGVANSKGAKYFRAHKPVMIRYQKSFFDRSSASKYEYQLKQLSKKQKLELIAENNQDS